LPLSEKVRIEIFIPDLPDPAYSRILDVLGNELSYAFGGCTVVMGSGKYRSADGVILPDKVNVLFSDTPFLWERDRLIVEQYAERIGASYSVLLLARNLFWQHFIRSITPNSFRLVPA
jgi:hypothetical protein